jgi:hypothetical protein
VTVNGAAVISGSASGAIALAVGPNTITTVVTAQDGTTTKTYTATVTRAAPAPIERLTNGGFNLYKGASKIPTGWVAANFAATDGKFTTAKKEGTASVKIAGATGKTKTLTQTLVLSGQAGDAFTFSFWAKGATIPAAGICQAQVLFYDGTKLKLTKTVPCKTGTYAVFQQKTLSFTVPYAYTKIVIKFTYTKAKGTVWFDAVSLMR